MSRLLDIYPESFAFVQYQLEDDATEWGDQRWLLYEGQYTPTAVFAGIDSVVGSAEDEDVQYGIYRVNHFLPRRGLPVDVTVELGIVHLGSQTYRAEAEYAQMPQWPDPHLPCARRAE